MRTFGACWGGCERTPCTPPGYGPAKMRLLLLSFFNNFAKTSILLHSRFHAPIITVTMKVLVFLTLKRAHIVARHAKQDLLEINVNGKVCMSIEANNLKPNPP